MTASSRPSESSHEAGARLRRSVTFRFLIAVVTLLAAVIPRLSQAVDTSVRPSAITPAPSNIVIGFVGGFVAHDNPHHGPVQLAKLIQQACPNGTYVRVFENRRRKLAYYNVIHLLDANHDGVLSGEEKTRAHIILFGHSWGASAAVLLARDLRRQGIPVSLTVQVDSIAKLWQNDSLIPDNVAEAVNFYQTEGILHGRRVIAAADPNRTEILGNYRMDYKKTPVQCPEASWWEHILTPGHMQSECDPHLWSQVENLVRQRLSSPSTASTVASTDHPQPSR